MSNNAGGSQFVCISSKDENGDTSQTTSDQIDTTGNPLSGGEKRSPFDGQSSEAIVREVNLSRDYAKVRRELFDLMERPGLLALVHVQNQNQNPPNPGSLRACVE